VFRFRILKEIKKRLKRKRRHIWSLGIGAAVFLLATLAGFWAAHRMVTAGPLSSSVVDESSVVWSDNLDTAPQAESTVRKQVLSALRSWKGEVEIVLHRSYLCGEETRKLGRHTTSQAADLLKTHRTWEGKLDAQGQLVLEEAVDDLSPLCRNTAYIGMDDNGNLALFDGPPDKGNVIRTFFQLDVETLETNLTEQRRHELARGIRISDRDEYNSVISTYTDFAKFKSQQVLQPKEDAK
jgi:forespore regulator of the sigma-K checkpoint